MRVAMARVVRGGERRRGDASGVAEVSCGGVQGKLVDRGPEIEVIAGTATAEAAEDVPFDVHGENVRLKTRSREARRVWARSVNRARAAKLGTAPTHRLEAEQVQHVAHRDPLAKGAIVDAGHGGSVHRQAADRAGSRLARLAR